MVTPSFREDHISQLPALQVLVKLGYSYLSQEEALSARGGKTTNVLLEDILRKQLKEINSIKVSSTKTSVFSDANIEAGILALKNIPLNEGYIAACESAYNLITLGKDLEQSIDGDKKSFTLQYIDWENTGNNVFHVAEEYSVTKAASNEHYRPDIVLFVNGIPLCIIECKRPDMKDPLVQAISQQLRSQQDDGIQRLYIYAQVLLSIATQEARFGTNGTIPKFWANWIERFDEDSPAADQETEAHFRGELMRLRNEPLAPEQKDKLFTDRYRYVRSYFDSLENEKVLPSEQDIYLYGLCRPERLLDLTFNFIVFEAGEKKIARYQQYFLIKKTMKRLQPLVDGRRRGGVVWHTQGSGKSLTMVMLAQAIALDKNIRNPKIVLVTDRIDLDDQITKTFIKCGVPVENANTGQRLIDLLESKSDAVITTIINKFQAAVKKMPRPLESPNIFVLVDEGHRTQHGTFNIDMQKTLPNACFIAMTGTPLFKKDKNTAVRFGGIIDSYTVDQAVKDKAVVPLLYEGRHAMQKVNESPLDKYFDMVSEPLTPYQRADLKKKFSRADQLNIAEQKIYAIAWDISKHFKDNWQGKPFKGQVVCQNKDSAIRYKMFLDEHNIVSTEVLISAPDEREGEESAFAKSSDRVKQFWGKMMSEHSTEKKYQDNLINRFKKSENPEIIIVVDKLLTGFDEPKNTVLYLTRGLKGHTLLQAIARVNRVCDDKDYGYIIDYYGVLGELDTALETYSSMQEFDPDDLALTMTNIADEVSKLPHVHAQVWEIFKTVRNKRDFEAYAQLLRDEAKRNEFYERLAGFAKIFKVALSSLAFFRDTPAARIDEYKKDLAAFMNLRVAVIERYSDRVDYKQYEGQIQKLIDTHITTDEVRVITSLVNIFDKDKFRAEVEKTEGIAAKADKIASRTSKHITERMDEDPAFYKKFSELLKETIDLYSAQRINESQYLTKVKDIMDKVLTRTDSEIPAELNGRDVARAFYGLTLEGLKDKTQNGNLKEIATEAALKIDELVRKSVLDNGNPIVDWQFKSNITGKLQIDIGDYLIDEVRDKYDIDLTFGDMDAIAERCIDVSKIRYK